MCQFEYNNTLHFENLGIEEELFIEVVEHNHTEQHRDILVQELGAAHIVTAIVVIETTWVKLEARSTQLELVHVDVGCGEEPVQIVDREEEHLRVTLLVLTYLQHPLSHYLPHVKCYMSLYIGTVVILKIYCIIP